jgi:hypothetical protein
MEIIGADARLAGLQTCTTNNWTTKSIEDAVELNNSGKSLTVRFVDPSACDSANPALKTTTYTFANNSLTKSENGAAGQALLDDVDGSFTLLPDASAPDTANAVLITINVKSNQANFATRNFNSTYEFKNRLIARTANP